MIVRLVRLSSKDTKAVVLARCSIFSGLSKRELRQLASASEDIEVPAGKVLAREGRPGTEFFVIAEGEAEVTRDGKRLATLSGNDFFGEIALLDGGPRTATVTATTPLRAFILTTRAFWSVLNENQAVAQKILRAVARRFRALADDPTL